MKLSRRDFIKAAAGTLALIALPKTRQLINQVPTRVRQIKENAEIGSVVALGLDGAHLANAEDADDASWAIGFAARRIRAGETIEWIPGSNTKDIITRGRMKGVPFRIV